MRLHDIPVNTNVHLGDSRMKTLWGRLSYSAIRKGRCGVLRLATFSMVVLLVMVVTGFAQNAEDLFNEAILQERAVGNLRQAIQLYERVAMQASSNRALAAQALMGAARSYEKLGQAEQGRALYAQVARLYPEQDQAAAARESLAGTGIVQGTVTLSGTRQPVPGAAVWLSGGPIDPAAFSALQLFFRERGLEIALPPSGVADEGFFRYLSDMASARGISISNPGMQGALDAFRGSNNRRFSGTADSTGVFSIKNVTPGTYAVGWAREGYYPLETGISAAVLSGRTATVDLPMTRGATISGRVTDAFGQPLANMPVSAYAVFYQDGFPRLDGKVQKVTDDRGEYRLFWLDAGEYFIAASPRQPSGPPSVPAFNSPVSLASTSGIYYPGTTDIASAVPITVRGDAAISGIDITTRGGDTKAFKITGEVRSNIPANEATLPPTFSLVLQLLPRHDNPRELPPYQSNVLLKLAGNQHVGQFELDNVPPGSYTLMALGTQPTSPGSTSPRTPGVRGVASVNVDVASADVSRLSLEIHPNVDVRGTLTVDGNAPGRIAPRVSLQIDGALGQTPYYQGISARTAIADAATGAFVSPNIMAGRYRVRVSGIPPELYLADVRQSGRSVMDSGIDVERDAPLPIEVLLKSGARTIEGSVRDSTGKPAPNETVVLIPPREVRSNRARYYMARADASGRFRFQGVAPGEYSVFAWQALPDGAHFSERFVSKYEDAGKRINVAQTSVTGADVTLIPSVGR